MRIQPYAPATLYPRNITVTHFCYRLSRHQGRRPGRITSVEKSNDIIGNWTRYLPACSKVLPIKASEGWKHKKRLVLILLLLISVTGWVDTRDIGLEGLRHLKNPMTSSGIEPAIFQLVAKCSHKGQWGMKTQKAFGTLPTLNGGSQTQNSVSSYRNLISVKILFFAVFSRLRYA
jgi:hypothetical protein